MVGKLDRMFPILQNKIESTGLHQDGRTRNLLKIFAEDKLVNFNYEQKKIPLPSSVRSTFLVVFSPDGSKIGSTHGDHKIYITHAKTGKVIRTLGKNCDHFVYRSAFDSQFHSLFNNRLYC